MKSNDCSIQSFWQLNFILNSKWYWSTLKAWLDTFNLRLELNIYSKIGQYAKMYGLVYKRQNYLFIQHLLCWKKAAIRCWLEYKLQNSSLYAVMCTRTVALNKCVYVWMCRIHFFRLNSNNILRFIQTPNLTLCIFATHNSWRQNQTYTLTKCQIYITVLNVLRAELVRCYFFSFVFHFLCAIFEWMNKCYTW